MEILREVYVMDYENALAFVNPDGSIILITSNETGEPLPLTIGIGRTTRTVTLKPESFNTFVLR